MVIVVFAVTVTMQKLPLRVIVAAPEFPTSTVQPSVFAERITTAFAGDKFGSVTSMTAASAAERNAKAKFLNLNMPARRVNVEEILSKKVRVSERDV
jgi:hypothetical protein